MYPHTFLSFSPRPNAFLVDRRRCSGPIGVCAINVASLLLTIVCIAVYLSVFAAWLSRNVLTRAELDKSWVSGGGATVLQWSFWLLPAAALAQIMALVCAAAAAGVCGGGDGTPSLRCCRGEDSQAEVNMKDVMIY